jgi:outer membrane biosynthesis protein TonB
VNPSIPLDLRSKITSDVHIDVAVTIDVNGKVTDAKITSLQGGVARFISGQVLQAARLFQFRPAQENNKNVDSKMILTFRFSSGQRNEKSTK